MDFFKATVKPDKKLFRKAGDAFTHNNKYLKTDLVIGLIICWIFGPVLTYVCYINHYSEFLIMPTVGIILVFYYFFAPKILGNTLYKSQSKKNLAKETTYYFSDNDFRAETVDSRTVINYSAIEALLETDELYCLYVNKAVAHIIPKNSIENPLCDPKTFLESKVGQPFTFVKKKTAGKAVAKTLGTFVISIILTLAAGVAGDFQLCKPQTFSYENFSVTLDRHFTEWEENQKDDFSLASDEVIFILDKYAQKDAEYLFDEQHIDLEKIVKNFCTDVEVLDMKKISHNNYTIFYIDEDSGIKYYNAVSVQQIGNDYWIAQMYCEESLKEDYEENFDKWISSIEYKNNVI